MPYADPEAQKAYFRDYGLRNKERIVTRNRKRLEANPDLHAEVLVKAKERYRRLKERLGTEGLRAKKRAEYEAHKEKRLASSKEWRKRNPGCRAGESRRWRERYPEKAKDKQLREKYGIGLDRYREMLAEQQGACAICKGPPGGKYYDVDHDHETGAVRGLLCHRCNMAIGYIEHLERVRFDIALDYLKRSR